ncbi:transcriptional regulator YdeO [Escherichia coli]|nr:transcriptional regulator YdeO [Escherichia coli]
MSLVCSVIFIHHAFNANILDKDYAFSDGEILMVDNAVRTHFEPYERHFKEIGFTENTIKKYLQCTNIQTVTVPVPAKFLRASNVPTGLLNEMIAYLNSEERNHHNFSELLLFSCLSIFAACKGFITLLTNGVLSVSGKVRNIVNMKLAHPWKLKDICDCLYISESLLKKKLKVQVHDEQSFIEQAEWSMLVQLFNQRLQERIQSGELKTISGGTARSVKIAPDYQSLFFRVNARDDNMQDAANALMAELATIDQHGFSAEELDDVKSTRLTWLKNAVDQQAERDLRMLTSRLASSSLNNTPFLSPEETYQLSKRLWQQITVQSLAEKWQQLRKNQDAFWEQMVNNELAAKKALSPAAILALEKEYANKKLAAYIFPGRNLSLTVDADPQAEISSKETLAENLTSLTLSNGARVILAKSAGEEQKLQITAVSNKGDLSFPAQQKSLIALANKAVSGSGVGELSSSSLKRWSAENSVTMSSKVSGMNTLLSVSARTNNPEPGFQLINQRITHSTINDNIWASLQNAQIQALKTLDQRPAEKFAQQMYETRYADDRTKLLQENQIVQFTAADALAADRQLFSSPADITFVIVGNVSEDKLVALITRYLGSIKHSDSPLAAGKPLTRATDNASVTVKEQNEPVAQVSQWKRYDSRTPVNLATRMALDAFNVALAKDLRVNIREQASGAYSVSSRLSVDPQAKDISHLLAFTCQPERHDELLTLANEVMVKRLAKGISEQELNEYQQNVQRSLDIQQRSVQQLANTIVNSLIQYDDPAAWTEQEQLLKQMTVENVNTAVKQYLSHPVNTYTGVLLPK